MIILITRMIITELSLATGACRRLSLAKKKIIGRSRNYHPTLQDDNLEKQDDHPKKLPSSYSHEHACQLFLAFLRFSQLCLRFPQLFYAHIEVVVAFLVVNFFSFLVKNRDHVTFERRQQVEMNPTDLPQLFKPKFAGSNRRKTSKIDISNF